MFPRFSVRLGWMVRCSVRRLTYPYHPATGSPRILLFVQGLDFARYQAENWGSWARLCRTPGGCRVLQGR